MLYLKYRPKDFNEFIGNEEQKRILGKFLNHGNLPHTILFSGDTGTGKTTLARICSNKLGVKQSDIYEINTSNNRGIETAREIIELMGYNTFSGKARVFIIDEAHNTTKDWQNAMLKPLEDTGNNYFFLCTTNPEKLIKPLKNRCYEIKLRNLEEKEIIHLLKIVLKKENKIITMNVMKKIYDLSEGSPRKSLVLLEKVIDENEEVALKILANSEIGEEKQIIDLCKILLKTNDWNKVRVILKGLKDIDVEKIRYGVLGYMNSVLLNGRNDRAFKVIYYFSEPFYNSKFAGLVGACYQILFNE